jgi:hypothetical protein
MELFAVYTEVHKTGFYAGSGKVPVITFWTHAVLFELGNNIGTHGN